MNSHSSSDSIPALEVADATKISTDKGWTMFRSSRLVLHVECEEWRLYPEKIGMRTQQAFA